MAVDKNAWSIRAEKSVVDNNIDWGTVASKVTTELETIRDDRQVRKDAIDEATNSMMNELAKGEDINNATLSTALIDGGQSASEALQIQVNLMKKGLIKPRDYKIFLQKQQNAYTNLKNVVQNWDKWETKSNERLAQDPNSGLIIASVLERDFNSATSAFGNMENVKFIPTETGGMEAVRLIESPDCSEEDKAAGTCSMVMPNRQDNPDNFMNPNVVGTRQSFQLNTLDINAAMKGQVDALGAFLDTSGGLIFKSISDFRESDKYVKAKKLSVDAILAGGSLSLANVAGSMGYRFAQSEAQKEKIMEETGLDASQIIMYTSTDGKPVFKKDAFNNVKDGVLSGEEAMRNYLGDKFDVQLSDETKLTKGIDKTKATREDVILNEKEKVLGTDIRNLNNILTSENPDDVQGNLEALIESYNQKARDKGKYDVRGISGYVLNDGVIQFKFKNGDVSNEIARQSAGPDGIIGNADDIDVAINNQIYQLGQLLNPDMFTNQVQVDDWITGNSEDFQVGAQRGLSGEQIDEFLLDENNKKDVITNWKAQKKNKGKNPTEAQIKNHAENMFEDSLDVDFQMKDYNYDNVTPSSIMTDGINVGGKDRLKVNDGLGGSNEIKPTLLKNNMIGQIYKMIPDELIDDLKKEGGDIEVAQTGGTGTDKTKWNDSSVDIQRADVEFTFTFTKPDGTKELFVMDQDKLEELTGFADMGEVSFAEIYTVLEKEFVENIKEWGKGYRGSKRGQSGQVGRTKFNG